MKINMLITAILIILVASVAYAVDSTKPADHNATWTYDHGRAAKANQQSCFACHDERSECIACHEDTPPRNHTNTFINKTHGRMARWDKTNCQTCHRQDYCDACHETSYPMSHSRPGFATQGSAYFHCNVSCQMPISNWRNTPSQDCIVCHKTRPILQSGEPHRMN